jgi:hypothetical protein
MTTRVHDTGNFDSPTLQMPDRTGTAAFSIVDRLALLLICGGAFAIYWYSSWVIVERNASVMFGADTWFYTELAKGNIFARLSEDYFLDRIFRFHPLTVFLAAVWLTLLDPLTAWTTPLELLRGMFAVIGALGVWAAIYAFSAVAPRAQALLWGVIYAASLNIWFFSSIEESKIVSATLATLYLAIYLHQRNDWTQRGFLLLSGVLLAACLNEIVAAFMIAVPAIDTLLRKGWRWRELRWLFPHALIAPLAYLLIELLTLVFLSPETPHAEGASHLSTLLWYIAQNTITLDSIHAFAVRWLFFSIAAPELNVYFTNLSINYGGDFFPALWIYLANPIPAAVTISGLAIFAACLWNRPLAEQPPLTPLLLALAAYAAVRGVFFFLFIPGEYFLYGASMTLAHLLLFALPFAASRLPGRVWLLGFFAAALLLNNALFIFTVQAHS